MTFEEKACRYCDRPRKECKGEDVCLGERARLVGWDLSKQEDSWNRWHTIHAALQTVANASREQALREAAAVVEHQQFGGHNLETKLDVARRSAKAIRALQTKDKS